MHWLNVYKQTKISEYLCFYNHFCYTILADEDGPEMTFWIFAIQVEEDHIPVHKNKPKLYVLTAMQLAAVKGTQILTPIMW